MNGFAGSEQMNNSPDAVLCHVCWRRVGTRNLRLLPHRDKKGQRCPGSGSRV